MRIGINTRFLLKGKMEGFGWFTYETVKRIVINHPEHDFFFFFDRPFDQSFIFAKNVTAIVIPPPARHPILFKIWFNYGISKALKKYNIDLFFSPDGYLSLKTKTPQIGVIHDLNFEHFPEDLPKSARNYLKKYFPRFAKKAKTIITVSEFSKQDISNTYQIDPTNIHVVYNGASDLFVPVTNEIREKNRKVYTNELPYFLYVGALHPRKNLNRLLLAFDQFKAATDSKTQLLIVGEKLWKNTSFLSSFEQLAHKHEVHFSGHVPLEELTKMTASAKAMTFVSYFEGFGIPLVEAMKTETAILAGNKTALPEIVQDAALLVDPFSIESIKDGLIKIDQDEELRNRLIENGKIRAKAFNWDKSAYEIWEVLNKELNTN